MRLLIGAIFWYVRDPRTLCLGARFGRERGGGKGLARITMMLHVAGPFKKKFREFEQPWHIKRFDSVRQEILEQEPDILSDKPENERVHSSPLARPACELVRTLARMLPSRALFCWLAYMRDCLAEQVLGTHCGSAAAGVGRSLRRGRGESLHALVACIAIVISARTFLTD